MLGFLSFGQKQVGCRNCEFVSVLGGRFSDRTASLGFLVLIELSYPNRESKVSTTKVRNPKMYTSLKGSSIKRKRTKPAKPGSVLFLMCSFLWHFRSAETSAGDLPVMHFPNL
jgi:hypothetical protein